MSNSVWKHSQKRKKRDDWPKRKGDTLKEKEEVRKTLSHTLALARRGGEGGGNGARLDLLMIRKK